MAPSGEAAARTVGVAGDLRAEVAVPSRAAGAYSLVLVTYEVVCESGLAADKTPLGRGFLGWAAGTAGQAEIARLGYAPLPKEPRAGSPRRPPTSPDLARAPRRHSRPAPSE